MIDTFVVRVGSIYLWSLWTEPGPGTFIANGVAKSYGQAFRNARNFLKRNQNWIYD